MWCTFVGNTVNYCVQCWILAEWNERSRLWLSPWPSWCQLRLPRQGLQGQLVLPAHRGSRVLHRPRGGAVPHQELHTAALPQTHRVCPLVSEPGILWPVCQATAETPRIREREELLAIYISGHAIQLVTSIIHWLHMIESGLAFSFLWNKFGEKIN